MVYGLGDQITGEMYDNAGTQDPGGNLSTLGRFTFVPPARHGGRWEVAKAEFVPQLFDIDAGRVVDINQAIGQGADLTGDRDRVREVALSRGRGEGRAGDGEVARVQSTSTCAKVSSIRVSTLAQARTSASVSPPPTWRIRWCSRPSTAVMVERPVSVSLIRRTAGAPGSARSRPSRAPPRR